MMQSCSKRVKGILFTSQFGSSCLTEYESYQAIEKMFDNLLNGALRKYGVERVGVELSGALRSAEKSVVDIVIPRAIAKHADTETAKGLVLLMKRHSDALAAIREVGVNVAISLAPSLETASQRGKLHSRETV